MNPGDAVVGILGAGVTGQAVGRTLRARGLRAAWSDIGVGVAVRASRRFGGVVLDDPSELAVVDVVVLACPAPHSHLAAELLAEGCDVVSLSDDLDDVAALIDLDELALSLGRRLVVGAGMSPGLTGVLARHLAGQLDSTDEIHVALHGTGGPACARQHHDALGSRAIGWHDGEWIEHPGGSGRELLWFPEPIGPADCYRGALADPYLLRRAFPAAERISARVSARRRDRLTARLPLLAPPHRDGDRGAIRVEVRGGMADGSRVTNVVGAVGRTGDIAGTVAALYAEACATERAHIGARVGGDDADLARWLLLAAVDAGVLLQEYTGIARLGAE